MFWTIAFIAAGISCIDASTAPIDRPSVDKIAANVSDSLVLACTLIDRDSGPAGPVGPDTSTFVSDRTGTKQRLLSAVARGSSETMDVG